MKTLYSTNQVIKFVNIFHKVFAYNAFTDGESEASKPYIVDGEIDGMLKKILSNSGCAFTDDPKAKEFSLFDDDSYIVYFITGAQANRANEYFDFVELYGVKYLVIFLDYMWSACKDNYNYNNGLIKVDESAAQAIKFMGYSTFFDAITKLVNILLTTTMDPGLFTNSLAATAGGLYCRKIPFIAAAKCIFNIFGDLSDNDIGGPISYDELKEFAADETKFIFACNGLFVNE